MTDDSHKSFILDGIAFGFKILETDTVIELAFTENYTSVLTANVKPQLDIDFKNEVKTGRISLCPVQPVREHAVSAVLEKDTSAPRQIIDCSRLVVDALNLYISRP